MARTVAIGKQDFADIRKDDYFYIDKTHFIKEWWSGGDSVTLITRPRRFGKTLMLNTVDRFFSNRYTDQARYFEGLKVWSHDDMRFLQGTLPVIFISFADVKETVYDEALSKISGLMFSLYNNYSFLGTSDRLADSEKEYYLDAVKAYGDTDNPNSGRITTALKTLSELLYKHYDQKVIILMDEYDTPLQEAYVSGYWNKMAQLMRSLFNSTFKTNPSLDRALMTGITRVSRESMFSDLNNLKIISTTTNRYTDAFGFTEDEVFAALDEYSIEDKEGVKRWYDGFIFGETANIYNPWSILNYLQERKFQPYWSNTSSNSLASKLIREGDENLKFEFEDLLKGGSIRAEIDEQIVFDELGDDSESVWSLLMASGYLKPVNVDGEVYELALTNYEVQETFEQMVKRWFSKKTGYNSFCKALLQGEIEAMNHYMNKVALATFSSFDAGSKASDSEPERFYHGFVLGLLVELKDRYIVTSNRESGFGRYDVVLIPRNVKADLGIIIEFKVHNPKKESSLEDTVSVALKQIEEKRYAQTLLDHGVPHENIRSYGFAFRGKEVLIGQ